MKRDVEKEERIAEMRRSGMTLQEIGDSMHISRQRVEQLIVRGGLVPKGHICQKCREIVPFGSGPQHVAESHPKEPKDPFSRSKITPELEMKYETITEMYLAGERISDISLTVRASTGQPMTYGSIYRILRYQGIEPNRGAGHYKRDSLALKRYSEGQKRRWTTGNPAPNGWRADE